MQSITMMWPDTSGSARKKGVNIIDCRTLRNVYLQIPAEIAGYGVADFTPDGEGGESISLANTDS